MHKVVRRSILIDFLFYVVIALAGYFSNFDETDPIVLKRNSLPGQGTDIPIMISIISVILCIAVAYPVNYNPFR